MKPLYLHSDLEVSIEYCTRSTFHTKHNPEKYAGYFNEVKDALFKKFNHISVKGNPEEPASGRRAFDLKDQLGPMKDVSRPRLGSFEVTVTHGSTGTRTVFSKLESGRWPNPEGLARAVEKTLQGHSLPSLTPVNSARGKRQLREQRHPNLKEPRHPRSWVAPQPAHPTRVKDLKELSHRLYKKMAEEEFKPEEGEQETEPAYYEVTFDPLVLPAEILPTRSVIDSDDADPEVASKSGPPQAPTAPEAYGEMEQFENGATAAEKAPASLLEQTQDYGDDFEDDSPDHRTAPPAPQLPRPGEDLPEDDPATTPPLGSYNSKGAFQEAGSASTAEISALAAGLRTNRDPEDPGDAPAPTEFTLMSQDGPTIAPLNLEQSSYVDPQGHTMTAQQDDDYEDDFMEDPASPKGDPGSPTSPVFTQGEPSPKGDAYSDGFEADDVGEERDSPGVDDKVDDIDDNDDAYAFEEYEDDDGEAGKSATNVDKADSYDDFEADDAYDNEGFAEEDLDAAADAATAQYIKAAGVSGDYEDEEAVEEMENSESQ